jgi:CRISPR-associated protein Cmr2
LKRDRLTIRVVFNSGQYVQWTCPWDYLDILTKYRDRDRKTGKDANWTHLYSDWSQLKARHAIPLQDHSEQVDDRIALKIFELYFDDMERFEEHSQQIFKKSYTPKAVIEWLDGLVNVGWQLCSNT